MAEPVEVAIEYALLTKAQQFASSQSPAIAISLPNIAFTPPTAGQNVKWLRATFLPAPSVETGIAWDAHNRHYGLFQLDVFYGQGSGELAPGRLASAAMAYFGRGAKLTKDGATVLIHKQPYRGPMIKDDPWMMIPVSIPYLCFAKPAA
jgi:hypothetical protein